MKVGDLINTLSDADKDLEVLVSIKQGYILYAPIERIIIDDKYIEIEV